MDDGAMHAIRDKHKSLFPVGVIKVVGEFSSQDAVSLCDASGHEFARGLSNFDSKVGQKEQHLPQSLIVNLHGYIKHHKP